MDSGKLYGLKKEVLEAITEIGINCGISKITLFGSRARGDYKKRSDIDIAVYGGNVESFAIDIEEKVPTLLKFDVINMNKAVQKELIESIEKEGVVVYEKI